MAMKELAEFERICAIEAIPAGDILDAIVAEKVMGWLWPSILWTNCQGYRFYWNLPSLAFRPGEAEREYKTIGGYAFYTMNGARAVPKFSTDPAAAFGMLNHLKLYTSLKTIVPLEACRQALRHVGITEVVIGVAHYW